MYTMSALACGHKPLIRSYLRVPLLFVRSDGATSALTGYLDLGAGVLILW